MKPAFPIRVRRGSVIVNVFHQRAAGVFTVAYYEDGRRKLISFGDLAKAREEADRVAKGLPGYEALLDDAYRRNNSEVARANIRRRILDAIAKAYPWLTDECPRQKVPKLRD